MDWAGAIDITLLNAAISRTLFRVPTEPPARFCRGYLLIISLLLVWQPVSGQQSDRVYSVPCGQRNDGKGERSYRALPDYDSNL